MDKETFEELKKEKIESLEQQLFGLRMEYQAATVDPMAQERIKTAILQLKKVLEEFMNMELDTVPTVEEILAE